MPVNTYQQEALDFLKRNHIKMKITFRDVKANQLWGETQLRNRYYVYIKNEISGQSTSILFWDSIYNREHHLTPTEYDVLACLTKYDPGDYEEFCSEFGYESTIENEYGHMVRNKNAFQIWKACCREYEKVKRAFGDGEVLEELREIS